MTKSEVDETFLRIDADFSGEISKDEFEAWWIDGAPKDAGNTNKNTPSKDSGMMRRFSSFVKTTISPNAGTNPDDHNRLLHERCVLLPERSIGLLQ